MKNVGVLALQGSVAEHIHILEKIENVNPIKVKYKEDLDKIDGLIIPGGESTTLGKLLKKFGLLEFMKEKIAKGLPVWGTCAGMILLAKNIENNESIHLGVMDITVKRNAYGRQLASFQTVATIREIDPEPIPLIFIRAPYVSEIGDNVKVLLQVEDKIVACKQNKILATAFHPELTNNEAFHRYFIKTYIE